MKYKKLLKNNEDLNGKLLNDPMFPFIDSVTYKDGSYYEVHYDDYGQQYFVVYDDNGEIKEIGCGAYVSEYLDIIEYLHNQKIKKSKRS